MKKINSTALALFISCFISGFYVNAQSDTKNSTSNPNPAIGESTATNAKPTEEDKKALEGVIVEKYYVAEPSDWNNTKGGVMDKGSVTYRIYIDLKPNYWLQVVYGAPGHPLNIQTTTRFYNNTICGGYIGHNLNDEHINEDNCLLDSYITLNSAGRIYAGVPLADDNDGTHHLKRKAFANADGMTHGNLPQIKPFNLDMNFWNNDSNAAVFATTNGGWAGFSGNKAGALGPTPENKILIAQLTTSGKISFELNIQVATPSGGTVKFVAKNPEGDEVKFDGLTYKMVK